jgi:hypothetical protein
LIPRTGGDDGLAEPALARPRLSLDVEVDVEELLLRIRLQLVAKLRGGIPHVQQRLVMLVVDASRAFRYEPRQPDERQDELFLGRDGDSAAWIGDGRRASEAEADPAVKILA